MGGWTSIRHNDILKIMIGAFAILILGVAACLLNLSTIRSAYTENMVSEYQSQVMAGEESFFMGLSETENLLLSYINEISIEDETDPVVIQNKLSQTETFQILSGIAYITPSNIGYFSDQTIHDMESEYNEVLGISNNQFTLIEMEKENFLYYKIPVNENSEKGALLAWFDLDAFLGSAAFTGIEDIGSLFLTDQNGKILASGKESELEYKLNTSEIEESLSTAFSEEEDSTISGMTIVVPVKGFEDLYFVCVLNYTRILNQIDPVINKGVFACLIILFFFTIALVGSWFALKSNNKGFANIAYRDQVTGGYNFNYFQEMANKLLHENSQGEYVMHRMDIANFRYLNEAYGHMRADQVLRILTECATECFGKDCLIARMTSDQFVSIHLNTPELEEQRQQFQERVRRESRKIGIRFPIRIKMGIYQIRKADQNLDVIIDRANAARKTLINNTSTNLAYFSSAIIQNMHKQDKIQSEMVAALEHEEFHIYLQPKWDIIKNKLSGAEALVRWIKPDGNIVFPNDFIPVFESCGFIEKLDYYMLEKVCLIIQNMLKDGLTPTPISVNQSRVLLYNPEYVENVCNILDRYKVPKHLVELEITESLFMNEKEKMIQVMNELKRRNIHISMDDFGSGYSSLNLLKDVPFDILKIDRLFFSEAITSKSSTWILKKIIEMANGLGTKVVCEGVETLEQVEVLKQIGCECVQGYFYSKPIPEPLFLLKYLSNGGNNEFSETAG